MTQQFRYVGGHIEVFSENGEFLFSADTMQEAWEELSAQCVHLLCVYVHYAETVENIQITFVSLYKLQLAKVCLIAYNKDRKREAKASPKHLPYTEERRWGCNVEAAHFSGMDAWFSGSGTSLRPAGGCLQ